MFRRDGRRTISADKDGNGEEEEEEEDTAADENVLLFRRTTRNSSRKSQKVEQKYGREEERVFCGVDGAGGEEDEKNDGPVGGRARGRRGVALLIISRYLRYTKPTNSTRVGRFVVAIRARLGRAAEEVISRTLV